MRPRDRIKRLLHALGAERARQVHRGRTVDRGSPGVAHRRRSPADPGRATPTIAPAAASPRCSRSADGGFHPSTMLLRLLEPGSRVAARNARADPPPRFLPPRILRPADRAPAERCHPMRPLRSAHPRAHNDGCARARQRHRPPAAGRIASCAQRDRTVGSSMSGRDVIRMNTDAGSGSSSVLSSAFCAARTSASARSIIVTRRRPSNGRNTAPSMAARTCSILMDPVSPGSIVCTSACAPRTMRGRRHHGVDDSSAKRQVRLVAIAAWPRCSSAPARPRRRSAVLPTPSGPEKIRLGVSESRAIACESRLSSRRWPTTSRNGMMSRIVSCGTQV